MGGLFGITEGGGTMGLIGVKTNPASSRTFFSKVGLGSKYLLRRYLEVKAKDIQGSRHALDAFGTRKPGLKTDLFEG